MRKSAFVLTAILMFGLGTGRANAAIPPDFTNPPEGSYSGLTDPHWDGSTSPYARNLFWNFDGGSSAHSYYGSLDDVPGTGLTSTVGTGPIFNADALGFTSKNKSGSASFTVANNNSGAYTYFWLEMDVHVKGVKSGVDSYIEASLNSRSGPQSITGSWGTGNTLKWGPSYDGQKVNAWFKINTVPASETLNLRFKSVNADGAYAYADNVHIATTPEPIAAALFLTGAAVLGLRRRLRRHQAALA